MYFHGLHTHVHVHNFNMLKIVARNSTFTYVKKRACRFPISSSPANSPLKIFMHAYMLWELINHGHQWSSHNCMPRVLQMHALILINVNKSLSSKKQQILNNNGTMQK